jgi:hypothetical protein
MTKVAGVVPHDELYATLEALRNQTPDLSRTGSRAGTGRTDKKSRGGTSRQRASIQRIKGVQPMKQIFARTRT